jgi:hypothetical protein
MPNSVTMNVVELILWYSNHIRHLKNLGIGSKTDHGILVSQKMIDTLSNRVDAIKEKYHN